MTTAFYAIAENLVGPRPVKLPTGPGHPKILPGLPVILFSKGWDEVTFSGRSAVRGVEEVPPDSLLGEPPRVLVTFEDPVQFEHPRRLHILAGSLAKVRRFDAPERHFRRPVVAFTDRYDFETIERDLVDLDRTTFRLLFSALSQQLQARFVADHLVELGLRDERIQDYRAAARLLPRFIQEHLAAPLQLMEQLAGAQRLVSDRVGDPRVLGDGLMLADGSVDGDLVPLGGMAERAGQALRGMEVLRELTDKATALTGLEDLPDSPRVRARRSWNETIWLNG